QIAGAADDVRAECLDGLRGGDGFRKLCEMFELVDPVAALVVKPRILDRSCDERGACDQELDLCIRELAQSDGMERERTDWVAAFPEHRNRDERLELLLASSGTYLTRGSSSAFSRMSAASPRSSAHQARPSPRL